MSSDKYKIISRTSGWLGAAVVAYCDGSVTGGNPGGHGFAGWVVRSGSLRECTSRPPMAALVHEGSAYLGSGDLVTVNTAEYAAVHLAIEWVRRNVEPATQVIVRTDSKLVACQLSGDWSTRKAHLAVLRDDILRLASAHAYTFEWVPRRENQEADAMSRRLHYLADPFRRRIR